MFSYVKEKGIILFLVFFDNESVDELEEFGVDCYKIVFFDFVNLCLIEKVVLIGKLFIFFIGMVLLFEVEDVFWVVVYIGNW